MAVSTWNTGTSTTSATWTTSGTSSDTTQTYVQVFNPKPRIKIKDPYAGSIKETAQEIHRKKEFWDGIEWKEHTSYIPRKSITGKIIIGKMHKRQKETIVKGVLQHKQFAKTKELFQEKLKGKA